VNLGRDLLLAQAPEPLLAPPTPEGWTMLWGSEDVAYGGTGLPDVEREDGWHLPGHAAVVLR
jgi:maltooligosyltrehalose trehalohydrolase